MSHAGELSGAESNGGQSRRSNARDLPSPAHFSPDRFLRKKEKILAALRCEAHFSPDRFLRKKEKILAALRCFRYGGKACEVQVSAIPLTRL